MCYTSYNSLIIYFKKKLASVSKHLNTFKKFRIHISHILTVNIKAMKLFAFNSLLLIFLLVSSVSSVNITCRYWEFLSNSFQTRVYFYFKPKIEAYKCEVEEVNIVEPIQFVSNISGQHIENLHSNNDVNFLIISSRVCQYMPFGLTKFFPNLEALRIEKSGLRSIQWYDLYEFRNLSILYLNDNKLMTLDIGLFSFTPNLKHVDFSNNYIYHVDPIIFTDNESLKTLDFDGNACNIGLQAFIKLPEGKNNLILNLAQRCLKYGYIQYLKDNRGFEINSMYNPQEVDRITSFFPALSALDFPSDKI